MGYLRSGNMPESFARDGREANKKVSDAASACIQQADSVCAAYSAYRRKVVAILVIIGFVIGLLAMAFGRVAGVVVGIGICIGTIYLAVRIYERMSYKLNELQKISTDVKNQVRKIKLDG